MRKELPKSINLVDSINPPGDTFTIFYEWTFNIGKFLLIFVQIIVIAVFVMRLNVDRINNDLTMDINNQVELLLQDDFRANESKYRDFQIFLKDLELLDTTQVKNSRKIVSVLDSVPNNVKLENFSFSSDRIGANFTSNSLEDVKNYEAFLKQNPEYSDVKLNLEKKGNDDSGIEFTVSYTIVTGREDL